jgi:serine phosphatase RsbU (regulator of sigma subunit)
MSSCYNNIAYILANQDQHAAALEYNKKSLKIKQEAGDLSGQAMSIASIASIYKSMGDYAKAIDYGKQALELARQSGDVESLKNAGDVLNLAFAKVNKYKDAYEMLQLYMQMKDSLQNEESKSEVVRKDLQYNYSKQKELDEKEHEKKLAIQEEHRKKQRVMIFAIAAGLILVLLFTVFVINRLRVTSRQKKIIESQKKIVEEQKREVEVQKLELEHQKEIVEEKQQEIIDSITYAKRLQNAILPPKNYIDSHLPDNFVLYLPKDIVAGDFYWMETVGATTDKSGDMILIAAADSTGHGVPGAMVSIVCSNALNKAVKEFRLNKPGEILTKTRELVLETFAKSGEEIKDGMDVSLLCVDKLKKRVSWSGANNQLWYVSEGKLIEVKADKQPVGKSDQLRPFTTNEIEWKEGTVFYLMTDGYPDQFGGPKGKKFKYKHLEELLISISDRELTAQKEILAHTFNEWRGSLEQVDDVTILAVRI